MITTKEIILCKEIIDIVDDILHDKTWNQEKSTWEAPEHEYLMEVFDDIVKAHNDMLTVYCPLYSNENEEYSKQIRMKLKDFVGKLSNGEEESPKISKEMVDKIDATVNEVFREMGMEEVPRLYLVTIIIGAIAEYTGKPVELTKEGGDK